MHFNESYHTGIYFRTRVHYLHEVFNDRQSCMIFQALTEGMSSQNSTASNVNILDGFLDLGRNIFPENIFRASFQQVS